jgi:hypothetical protein
MPWGIHRKKGREEGAFPAFRSSCESVFKWLQQMGAPRHAVAVEDFYRGFEGEPEIRFVAKGAVGPDREVRIWVGYFSTIMDRIVPEGDGWTGLALPYHLCEGWYEDDGWRVPDLDGVISQWGKIALG